MRIFAFFLMFLLSFSFVFAQNDKGLYNTVYPQESEKAIINPGKGWTLMGQAKWQPEELIAIASLGYRRHQWEAIEPEEGKYRWDIIDNDIKEWSKRGKQFAFGVMCASTNSKTFWVTPKWVIDAGAKCDTFVISEFQDPKKTNIGARGYKQVPDFADPVFMKKLGDFVKALALRYDGNPNLAFIDIRSYGNWGEAHMFPFGKPDITADQFKDHILLYRNAFHITLLQLPTGKNSSFKSIFEWAVSVGIGLRRDGICGNSDGSEVKACCGKIPSVFELYDDYENMAKFGWWFGKKDLEGRGFRLEDCIENGRPTYVDFAHSKESGLKLMKDDPELVNKLTNRIGYHFVLHKVKYPNSLVPGISNPIEIDWGNKGVEKIFIPAKVAFALINSDGKLVEICNALSSIPSKWNPNCTINITDSLSFKTKEPGTYSLAIGIQQPDDWQKASIKLGIELPNVNGWYILGNIQIKLSSSSNSLTMEPPMGWNSWDCLGLEANEENIKAVADYMAVNLKKYGWQYVVIDAGWYHPKEVTTEHSNQKCPMQNIDRFGRLLPDTIKYPSSRGVKGFTELANYIHSKGLKFGIHMQRGIPWNAVSKNTPIKGTPYFAAQIRSFKDSCRWSPIMKYINFEKEGAQDYYNSVMELYADWGVDFLKIDDMPKAPFPDIEAVQKAIDKCGRPIVISLSGAQNPESAEYLAKNANMWRISGDFWDSWAMLKEQFDICARWTNFYMPGHWADPDMLPIGKLRKTGCDKWIADALGSSITGATNEYSRLTNAEKQTMMTLWTIFRAPLMVGGYLPENDSISLALLTNEEVLAVNKQSKNNQEISNTHGIRIWTANDEFTNDKYIALFNTTDKEMEINLLWTKIGLEGTFLVRDLWTKKDMGHFTKQYVTPISRHSCQLIRLKKIKNQ